MMIIMISISVSLRTTKLHRLINLWSWWVMCDVCDVPVCSVYLRLMLDGFSKCMHMLHLHMHSFIAHYCGLAFGGREYQQSNHIAKIFKIMQPDEWWVMRVLMMMLMQPRCILHTCVAVAAHTGPTNRSCTTVSCWLLHQHWFASQPDFNQLAQDKDKSVDKNQSTSFGNFTDISRKNYNNNNCVCKSTTFGLMRWHLNDIWSITKVT